jgi:hypothetical protein
MATRHPAEEGPRAPVIPSGLGSRFRANADLWFLKRFVHAGDWRTIGERKVAWRHMC